MAQKSNANSRRIDPTKGEEESSLGSLKSESRLIRLECLKIVKERALAAHTVLDMEPLLTAAKELESWVLTGK